MNKKSLRVGLLCAALFLVVVSTTSCVTTWVSLVSGALPTIETLVGAILAFVAGLTGKTISTAVASAISKVVEDAKTSLATVRGLIDDWNANPDPSLVGKISAALSDTVSKLGSILTGLSIDNPATVGKLGQLITLAVAAIQAALAIVPLFGLKGADTVKLSSTQVSALKNHAQDFKDHYNLILSEPSGDADVDSVLKTLKRA